MEKMVVGEGVVYDNYGLEWDVVGDKGVSYGHNLEASWLVGDIVDLMVKKGKLCEETARVD